MIAAEVSARAQFETSWGAQRLADGRVRFRIWAPACPNLVVRIDGSDRPMRPSDEGWHEISIAGIAAGTPYNFVLPDGLVVPDPASRAQQGDVHGPSLVVDPHAYQWRDGGWRTRPWEETVYYELHIGTFTPEGTFRAAARKLGHVAELGVTTLEIMPVGQFSGRRGWGYDGVLMYAPHSDYGTPDDFKALVDAAHAHGLNIVLDVIYNHFGPDGNYLPVYAPAFFHPERKTPWGAGIAYDAPAPRQYLMENALYWLEDYHFDGLRFDAIDHIRDELSATEFLVETAQRIRQRHPDRLVHLTTEDNRNITYLHERDAAGRPRLYSGEWNDDFHNVAHVIATGETEGYYVDFAEDHWGKIARCLAEGFGYQGEPSPYDGGKPRGVPSASLPPTAFVDFIQNHDQVGNRAFGERLLDLASAHMVETLLAMLLLSPHIPLLFMGEEWGERQPFVFFSDMPGALADIVREGRRKEFEGFSAFRGESARGEIPDPIAVLSFESSRLDWARRESADGQRWMALVKRLLTLRAERIVPLITGAGGHCGRIVRAEDGVVAVSWALNGGDLHLVANLSSEPQRAQLPSGDVIFALRDADRTLADEGVLGGTSLVVAIER